MKRLFFLSYILICVSAQMLASVTQSYNYMPTESDRSNTTERIIDFHADIKIMPDGNAVITEYLTLYAAGIGIKRGILRNIPEYRIDKNGTKRTLPVNIISLKRNGESSEYHTEISYDSGERERVIYFGSSNVMLEKDVHQYELVYETRGHVGFFDEYDEFYWVVVGFDWVYAFEGVSARLHPPGDSEAIQWSCYTGVYGSREKACDCDGDKNMPLLKASRTLQPGEGFTISVAFPRDIITRPTAAELYYEQNWNWISGAYFLLALFVFMFITWLIVGRDARKQLVIPQFSPPNGWSAEKVRYLYKRIFDKTAFTVALLQMAVKGAVKIECRPNGKIVNYYLIDRGEQSTIKHKPINNDQHVVYKKLFGGEKIIKKIDGKDYYYEEPEKKEVEISIANRSIFIAAMDSIKKAVTTLIPIKHFYKHNTGLVSACALINIIFCMAYNFYLYDMESTFVPFFIIPLIGLIMSIIYLYVIGARTEFGSKVKAELDGFKMYLGTAEKQWLNQLMPPEKTPEHFEEMLPYAVALDVGNEWCRKFSDVLKMNNYTPEWYGSDRSDSDYLSDILSTGFLSTIDRSVSTASTPEPSSSDSGSSSWSSGSDGGGYSGGGGGGGGGRGW
jgi:Predicted membrane protein